MINDNDQGSGIETTGITHSDSCEIAITQSLTHKLPLQSNL